MEPVTGKVRPNLYGSPRCFLCGSEEFLKLVGINKNNFEIGHLWTCRNCEQICMDAEFKWDLIIGKRL